MNRLRWLVATENRKLLLTSIAWTVGLSSVYAEALFTRGYAMWYEQGLAIGICFVAGALIGDIGRSLAGFIASIITTFVILIFLATESVSVAYLSPTGVAIMQRVLLIAIFRETFPFPTILSIAASLIGSMVGERSA